MVIHATAARNASDATLTPVTSLSREGVGARQITSIVMDTGSAAPDAFWEEGARYRIEVSKVN